jgi:hypothetical protein
MGGTQNNDSQDELFKESIQSLGGRSTAGDKSPGITVNTTILQQHSAETQARMSQARLDSFA